MDELEYLRMEVERLRADIANVTLQRDAALDTEKAWKETALAAMAEREATAMKMLAEIERLRAISDKYIKLLMLVTDVCPGETRHETAVRLLQQRQEFNSAQAGKVE